jgi:hypothetical protein
MGCSSSVAAKDPLHDNGSAHLSKAINGVSLDYLVEFAKNSGGQLLAGMNCHDVCELVIKPMTLRTGYKATGGQSVAHMLDAAFDTRPGDVQRACW